MKRTFKFLKQTPAFFDFCWPMTCTNSSYQTTYYMKMSTWKFPKMVGFPNKHGGFTKSDHFGGVLGVPPFKETPTWKLNDNLAIRSWFNWRLHLTCPTPDHLTGHRIGQISWVHRSPNVFLVPFKDARMPLWKENLPVRFNIRFIHRLVKNRVPRTPAS